MYGIANNLIFLLQSVIEIVLSLKYCSLTERENVTNKSKLITQAIVEKTKMKWFSGKRDHEKLFFFIKTYIHIQYQLYFVLEHHTSRL
jgi:hypothetical protein